MISNIHVSKGATIVRQSKRKSYLILIAFKLFFIFIFALTSCKPVEMFELSDGTLITMRKADRMVKRIIRKEFHKLSKTGKSDVMYMTVETEESDK